MNATIAMAQEECYKCAIVFWMPASFQRQCREKGTSFYCPSGHSQVYRETEVVRLKRKLEQEQECCEFNRKRASSLERENEYLARSRNGMKGAMTRWKKRLDPEAEPEQEEADE